MKKGSQELINSFNELILRSEIKLKIGSYSIKNENVEEISLETKIDSSKQIWGQIAQSFLNVSLKGSDLINLGIKKGDLISLEIGNQTNATNHLLGLEDKKVEYFKFQEFEIVENVEFSLEENRIFIKARDNVYKLFNLYEKSTSDLSLTELIKYVLNKNNIAYDSKEIDKLSTSPLNITVSSNKYGENTDNKNTYYDVLSDCLEIIGFIAFNSSENLQIIPLKMNKNPIISTKNYDNFKVTKTILDSPINTVVYRTKDIEGENVTFKENQNQNKNIEYVCEDNGIANLVSIREQLGEHTLNKVKGLSFPSFELTRFNKPYLEIGDLIQRENINYFIGHSLIKWNGAINCSYGMTLEEKQIDTPLQNKPITRLIQDTKIEVKKDIQEIQIEITRVNEEVNQVKQTFSPTQIETTITNVANTKLNELLEQKIQEISQEVDNKLALKQEAVLIQLEEPEDKTRAWLNPITGELKLYVRDSWQLVNDYSEVSRLLKERFTILEGKVSSKEDLALLVSDFLKLGNDWETYKRILNGDYDRFKESQDQFRSDLETLKTTITQDAQGLLIKNNQGNLSVRLGNSKLQFLDNGVEVAYVSNQRLFINSGVFLSSLVIGNFKISKSEDGTMLFFDYVGGEY